ncbi:MAG: FtsQ-type POTRA domain-containing protein [Candidatus Gracilibacteria bacterium]|nr:FtsQ-type POTRA domain-containing protein [Candidatus Gracilibacteria bacterium]MDD3120290.1 FtsQ-type POTRA domain-containing protein [Candidatus Gracilibacteria bacterium]MDD4530464.1 FtsQ-type POTRA domain-containing protein [Candidatus Gracilibacteria bacterium]
MRGIKEILTKIQRIFERNKENRKFKKSSFLEKKRKYLFSFKKESFLKKILKKFKNKKLDAFRSVFTFVNSKGKEFGIYFIIIGTFLVLSTIYIIFISPYFKISQNKVIIERLDEITDTNIAYKAIDSVYGQSIFLIDKNEIKKSIVDRQKNIKKITIGRLYPNGLKIILESYRPQFYTSFISQINQEVKTYIVTSNGILVYQKSQNNKLPKIDIINPELEKLGLFDYKEGIQTEEMPKIMRIMELLGKQFPNLKINKLTYFRYEKELHITLENGSIIITELSDDTQIVDKEIGFLKIYDSNNKEILQDGSIKYIDVRNPYKLFVCKEKSNCIKNLRKIYGDYYN